MTCDSGRCSRDRRLLADRRHKCDTIEQLTHTGMQGIGLRYNCDKIKQRIPEAEAGARGAARVGDGAGGRRRGVRKQAIESTGDP